MSCSVSNMASTKKWLKMLVSNDQTRILFGGKPHDLAMSES